MSITITSAIGTISTDFGMYTKIIGSGFSNELRYIIQYNGKYIPGNIIFTDSTTIHISESFVITNDTSINFSLTGGVKFIPFAHPLTYRPSGSASGDVLYMIVRIDPPDPPIVKIMKSIDQGQTWTDIYTYAHYSFRTETNMPSHRKGILKTNKSGSYVAFSMSATYEGTSIYSTDYGNSWNPSAINYIFFTNEYGDTVYGTSFLAEGTVIGGDTIPMTNWYIVKSTDYGETVSKVLLTAPESMYNNYMASLDCSIIYCVKDYKLYRSVDSGDTWAEVTSAGQRTFSFVTMCMSDDASVVFVSYEESTSTHVLRSTDSGVTWDTCFSNDYKWPIIMVCNPTGQLLSIITKTYIPWYLPDSHVLSMMAFISVDYGNTIIPKSINENIGFGSFQPYMNTDGTLMMGAGKFDGTGDPGIYNFISYSNDYMSLINSTMTIIHPTYKLYVTNDFGQTWQLKNEREVNVLDSRYDFASAIISNDGSKVHIFSNDGNMYTSLNGGDTWNTNPYPFNLDQKYIDRWSISTNTTCDYIILSDWSTDVFAAQTMYWTQDGGTTWDLGYSFLSKGNNQVSDMSCDNQLQIVLTALPGGEE